MTNPERTRETDAQPDRVTTVVEGEITGTDDNLEDVVGSIVTEQLARLMAAMGRR